MQICCFELVKSIIAISPLTALSLAPSDTFTVRHLMWEWDLDTKRSCIFRITHEWYVKSQGRSIDEG